MAALHPVFLYLAFAAAIAAVLWRTKRRGGSALPLPPGPPRLPIIGNMLDMPKHDMHETFRDMCTKYGDVLYLDVCGQPMIILGSHEVAIDLLEKRSANYSDRPSSVMADLSEFHWALASQRYGSWWRRHRRALHQYLNPNAIKNYYASQKLEAHRFVRRLIDSPEDFLHHTRHYFGSAVMRVTYGIEVDDEDEDYLGIAEDLMTRFSEVFTPGKYAVEGFPSLRHVFPPRMGFKRDAEELRLASLRMINIPWSTTRAAMNKGTAAPSMVSGLVEGLQAGEKSQVQADDEDVIKNAAANAYGGGADTTFSTVLTFFAAMTMFPDVQKKAQAELMSVVGPNRLPEYEDESSLPYIRAIAKECLRWRSVAPLGVPHRVLEEDEYRGFRIPKGAVVLPNIWAYSRDPTVYDSPEAFMPERFLTPDGRFDRPDVRDPATIAFGYGRRICPGRHFAESSLFMVVSTVLHTLNISAPIGRDGKPILPSGKMVTGLLSHPEPYECVIKSRSDQGEALIRASCQEPHGAQAVQ